MKHKMINLLLACFISLSAGAKTAEEITSADSTRILFIGNSYVFFNNMPGMLQSIAQSNGKNIAWKMIAPGGYSLQRHLQNPEVLTALKQNQWDFIVLQEQSHLPAMQIDSVKNKVYTAAHSLDSLRGVYNPKAKLVYYMTWGRKDGYDKLDEIATYASMQERLKDRYLEITCQTKAICAPVGVSWQRIRKERKEMELYIADGSHPSLQGSYLAANVLYTTMFPKSYKSSYYSDLPQEEALYLQQTAQETVLSNQAAWNIKPVRQPKEVTDHFYPAPSQRISTPVFPTSDPFILPSYTDIMQFLEQQQALHPAQAQLKSIGKTPTGRDIPIFYIGDRSESSANIKVWIQGGLHGNEPAGVDALCRLINYVLNEAEGEKLLQGLSLAIVPVANVDGYAVQERTSASGFDLNRDQTKLTDKVSILIKEAFSGFNAGVVLDIHEYTPLRADYSILREGEIATYYDALFLLTGYHNVPEILRRTSIDLFQHQAQEALTAKGFSHSFYFTAEAPDGKIILTKDANSPRSSTTSYALSNAISLLLEIRGIGLGTVAFERRTNAAFTGALSLLETAYTHSEEVKQTIADAIRQTLKRENDIVVTTQPTIQNYPVTFVDYHRNDTFSVVLPAYDALSVKPLLTRKRPVAYILEDTCGKVVENLRALGLTVELLKENTKYKVEQYEVSEYKESPVLWENIHTVQVKTSVKTSSKEFPTGTYFIPLAQKNANFAVSMLEPESSNGLVSYRVIQTGLNKTLPIYRLMLYDGS